LFWQLQILDYLRQNAHPEMRKRNPVVPETITDQLLLWESERNRVQYHRGVLFDTFPTHEAFLKVVDYAKDLGVFIWSNPKERYLMITESGHGDIHKFMKKNLA
jgi:transcription initiation factor TFIIH subunit 4